MARRGMSTAPNWAEAVEALSYSKNQTKQKMLDRSRVSDTKMNYLITHRNQKYDRGDDKLARTFPLVIGRFVEFNEI